jgi:beta-carotene hydroxylase
MSNIPILANYDTLLAGFALFASARFVHSRTSGYFRTGSNALTHADAIDRRATAAARKYMGMVAWPTIALGLAIPALYILTVGLALAGLLSLWVAVPLVALLTYLSYSVLHESVHGSITGNNRSLRWLNKGLGYIAAWIVMIPLTAHRQEHIAHHRYANDESRDPDFHIGKMGESPWAPVLAVLRAYVTQFAYFLGTRRAGESPRRTLVLGLEVAAAVLPRLTVLAAGYWLEGLALFALAWLIGAVVLLYLFAYVVHRPHEQVGRYHDTSTVLVPRSLETPLSWIWMFQNFHSIHHLFPRVPFYKYADLYREIEDVLDARQAPVYRMSIRGLEQVSSSPVV